METKNLDQNALRLSPAIRHLALAISSYWTKSQDEALGSAFPANEALQGMATDVLETLLGEELKPKLRFDHFKFVVNASLKASLKHKLHYLRKGRMYTLDIVPKDWRLDEASDRLVHLPTTRLVQERRQLSDVCRKHGCSIKEDESMQASHMEHPGLKVDEKATAAAVTPARYEVVELDQAFRDTYDKVFAIIKDMIDVFFGEDASPALKFNIFKLLQKIEESYKKVYNPKITIKGRKHILRIDTEEWELDEQAAMLVHKPSVRAEVERLGIVEACLVKGCSTLCVEKGMEEFFSRRPRD